MPARLRRASETSWHTDPPTEPPCLPERGHGAALVRRAHAVRAIVLEKFDGLDSLVYKDIPKPEPLAGHVVIQIKAFGINHAEMHVRRGEWAEAGNASPRRSLLPGGLAGWPRPDPRLQPAPADGEQGLSDLLRQLRLRHARIPALRRAPATDRRGCGCGPAGRKVCNARKRDQDRKSTRLNSSH